MVQSRGGLTTHSTGARVSLPFIVNLNGFGDSLRPVNSGVRLLINCAYEHTAKAAIFEACDLNGMKTKLLQTLKSTRSLLKRLLLFSVTRSQIHLMILTIPLESVDLLSSACRNRVEC